MDKNYILIIGWVAVMAMLSVLTSVKQEETVCGKKEYRWRPVWAVVTFLPLIIWCGYRGNIGDTWAYKKSFSEMPVSLGGMASYMATVKKDKGFYFVSAVIKCIVGNHVNIYFIVLAVIQAGVLIYVYRKYSSRYLMSFFLFLASTDYISWMFNGIRQFTAVTITFIGIKFILDKKYVKAIVLILIASLMHQSALLMIPFIFIVQGKAWNKKSVLCILGCILILIFVNQFTDGMNNILSNTQYSNMVADWKEWEDNGTNPIRVFVYSIPMILSIIGRKQIKEADNPVINIVTNFSILTSVIAMVSMKTSGIFIGRLISYGSMYSASILLPWEIENIFTRNSTIIIKSATVLGYIGFFYYQMHFIWGLI